MIEEPKYPHKKLITMSRDEIFKAMKSYPRGSIEQNRIFKYFLASSDRNTLKQMPADTDGNIKIEPSKKDKYLGKINKIVCKYDGLSTRGFSQCVLFGEEKEYNVKDITVINFKPTIIANMGLDPQGILLNIKATDMFHVGNTLVDINAYKAFRYNNPELILAINKTTKLLRTGSIDQLSQHTI